MLEELFLLHNIHSPFVYDVDEEGHDEYNDAKQTDQLVVPQENISKLFYLIERKSDHTTLVGSIAVDGTYLNPLIIIKRKTIKALIIRQGLCDKVMIRYQESVYLNSEILDALVKDIFISEVRERHSKYNYTWLAVLILEGCS